MSIYAYVGMPGSGKSYDVVASQIVPALKQGRRVVTNVPLNMAAVLELVPGAVVDELPVEKVLADPPSIYDFAKPGCLLVIDECWRLWPQGVKADKVPEAFRKLLAEHRHMVDAKGDSMQIVLVTQDLAQIAPFARQLVEQTFMHTKLSHLGANKSYRIDVYQGGRTGQNLVRKQRLREILGRYDSAIFPLYKSHTMSESGSSGANEKAVDNRGNIWRRPMIWISAAAVIAALVWGVPTVSGFFHKPGGETRRESGATAPGSSAPRPVRSLGPAQAPPVQLGPPLWRVAGVIQFGGEGEGLAILERSDGLTVRISLTSCQVLQFETRCVYDGGRWSSIARRVPVRPPGSGAPSAPEAPAVSAGA